MGEEQIRSSSDDDLRATLVHEAAHAGDSTRCPRIDYGLDGLHFLNEVLSPAAALKEGWAVWMSTRVVAPDHRLRLAIQAPPRDLIAEGSEPGVYTSIPWRDARVADLLSTEGWVAHVLSEVGSGSGWKPLLDAWYRTRNSACRTVATLLETRWHLAAREQQATLLPDLARALGGKPTETDLGIIYFHGLVPGAPQEPPPPPLFGVPLGPGGA
jgi:hypothetical protein